MKKFEITVSDTPDLKRQRRMSNRRWFSACIAFLLLQSGCSTGFGDPCTVPQTPQFRQACNTISDDVEDDGSAIETQSSASCALENFAGCETRVCLVYRGSSAFCSLRCQNDGGCEGGAVCAPLLGNVGRDCCDPAVREAPESRERCAGFLPGVACYCIRESDIPAPVAATCENNNDCFSEEVCCPEIGECRTSCDGSPPMSVE